MSRARALRRAARAAVVVLDALGRARMSSDGALARAERLRECASELADVHGLVIAARGVWTAGPAVLVANHVSYLDPVAIGSLFACAPIAKGEVAGWPVIGPTARSLGVTFVRRGDAHSGARALLRARECLRAGVPVLNFPEGTTTDGGRLLPFKSGIFGLARLVGVPVVPIALRYACADLAWTGGATFVPHYLRTAARRAPAVHLEVGAPIATERFASASELARFTRDRIARMLRDLPEPHAASLSIRVPAPRTDAVLPPAGRHLAGAR